MTGRVTAALCAVVLVLSSALVRAEGSATPDAAGPVEEEIRRLVGERDRCIERSRSSDERRACLAALEAEIERIRGYARTHGDVLPPPATRDRIDVAPR